MLANERLIFKMSLEQKVKLITSLKLYENSPDENYEFPVFKLTRNPLEESAGVFATQFPSDKALASSWNPSLVSEVCSKRGDEVAAVKKYAYFNVTDSNGAEDISEDFYLTAKVLGGKLNGLSRARQFVNFEEFAPESGEEQYVKNLQDVILASSAPRSVYLKSPEHIENYKAQKNSGCLFFGAAGSADEALRYFLNGCTLVFLKEDFTKELTERLKTLTVGYRAAYADYRAEEISLSELDARCRRLEIFDEEILNGACDRLISTLLEMRKRGQEAVPAKSSLNSNRVAMFDEVADDALAATAARQSIVLLKNNFVLPLRNTTKVAVLGECAKDYEYQKEFFSGKATAERVPYYAVNNYEINTVGFASGYARGESGRRDLIDAAVDLGKEAELSIVWLSAERNAKTLPAGQAELIDELYKNGVKIIAVVASDGVIDCAFAEKCEAVLLTYRGGQGSSQAVFDVLKGIATPSGRLTETVPVNVESGANYLSARSEVRYPFGYGLSYTKFEYSKLKINERGISCTVKNVGASDGFAVPQFYLQKAGSKSILKHKILRGFEKVYIRKNDAVRVEILFDENTFKVFDKDSGLYRIEGGEYTVIVGENYFDDKLSGTVTLSEYVFKDFYKGEVVESVKNGDGTTVKFDVNQEPPEVRKAKKQLSFGLKLFVAILLALYYEGAMAALAFTDIVAEKDLIFYCVVGAFAAVCVILFITYVVVIAKKRKKQHYVPVNDVLTDLVENVKEFDEISKVTYVEPLKEEPEEDEPEIKAEEIQKEKSYDLSIEEDEEASVAERITFREICNNFQSYALSFGVTVDITSVRALFAAIGASKAVIVTTKNTEVMPDFLNALSRYLSNREPTAAGAEWRTLADLIWKQQDDKFVLSDFANTVYAASKSPDRLYGAVIDGVKAETLLSWFAPFVTYANHPTEEYTLNFNEELSLRLPDNICYILSPAEGCGDKFPREVADAALQLDLVLSKADGDGEVEAAVISKAALSELEKEARESFYMSERVWKKLDELFETVRANEKFRLGNKNTLQLEKFTSVLLECGGDEAECITDIFLAKIVPLLKLTRAYSQDGGDKTLFGIIEKLFNEEELTKIQRALSKTV